MFEDWTIIYFWIELWLERFDLGLSYNLRDEIYIIFMIKLFLSHTIYKSVWFLFPAIKFYLIFFRNLSLFFFFTNYLFHLLILFAIAFSKIFWCLILKFWIVVCNWILQCKCSLLFILNWNLSCFLKVIVSISLIWSHLFRNFYVAVIAYL